MSGKYTIKSGDNLSKIAQAHGVTPGELLKANPQFSQGGRNPDLIYPGEEVTIPNTAVSSTKNVKSGCATCKKCIIESETVATIPSDRKRTTIGVGEEVKLTFSLGEATWKNSEGKLSSNSGSTVIFTAPDRAKKVEIEANGNGCTAKLDITVIEPSGVSMQRAPGTGIWHDQGIPSIGIRTIIFITPNTVSFENIEISEDDCVGIVTGYFVGTPLDGVRHAGHGAGTWVTVGNVVQGSGSQVDGQDTAQSGHCNFGLPYANGTFDWPIPWLFRVNGGASKQFAIVHQRFTIDAAGAMTVSKAGASANASLNDPNSTY